MSRRNNNVRGPTSALTEFLRESGINPDLIARRVATRGQNRADQQPSAGPSNSNAGANDASVHNGTQGIVSEATPNAQANASGYASDQLDDPVEESPSKKRRVTRGNAMAAAKARAKKKAKEDGECEGSSEDEYTALSTSVWSKGGGGGPKHPIGSFQNCAKCEIQFTVTKYTIAANPQPGYLCHPCAKDSGIDPFKKPAAPKKRNPAAAKRDIVDFEERRLPTLAALCIELISRHIDDVEALGDIGSLNMDEIAKALAKNRSLTPQNATLFYDVRNKTLRFYDATHLTPTAFIALASLNPNLTHLHLDLCGRLDCSVLQAFSQSLHHLTSLTLLGPFLVRAETWVEFFRAKPDLRTLCITQSPRFDLSCVGELAQRCTELEKLQLREVGQLDDTFVESLCALPPLKLLDLSRPDRGIGEAGWIQLMERHGRTLEVFNPSWHAGFTGGALHALRKHARALSELTLEGCESLDDNSVSLFFGVGRVPPADEESTLECAMDTRDDVCSDDDLAAVPPLHVLSLARNHGLSDAALTALLDHSGSTLVSLDLNALRALSADALVSLKRASELRRLDLSWCREVDDFVMKDVVAGMPKLEQVKVWGCSRIRGTGWTRKRGLKVYGVEPNAES